MTFGRMNTGDKAASVSSLVSEAGKFLRDITNAWK
jgi:hypothetical protein